MLLATFAFTIMQVFVKAVSNIPIAEVVFFRSFITSILCMFYLARNQVPLIGKRQTFLLIRAGCGIISMSLFFTTLQRMPLGASVSLNYLSPIFTAIFAVLLIKEKIKPIQWLFFATALFGVFLLKGFDTRIDTLNLTFAITGALFGGLAYVIIRKIGNSEHPMVIVNYFMLSATIIAGIVMIPFWKTPNLTEWALLIAIGTLGYFGQIYMTKAFQLEAASQLAPIKYMELVFSLIIGFSWFGEGYSLFSFLGILLILGSMILNILMAKK